MSFHYRNFVLDESEGLPYTEWEENERINKMFNAFDIAKNDFIVTFLKTDGTLRTMQGNLFGPDKGAGLSADSFEAHLVATQESNHVKMFTDQGWRSFLKTNLLSLVIVGKDTI